MQDREFQEFRTTRVTGGGSTRGQFFIRHECGACIRLRTNTSLIRMISRSAYGFGKFVITCLHTSDERVQTLYTSCIRIVSNPFSVLHT